MGTAERIRWKYTGNPGPYVKIQLLKNGVVHRTIRSSTPLRQAVVGMVLITGEYLLTLLMALIIGLESRAPQLVYMITATAAPRFPDK
jgi:hypothetical protein